jgi:hypothetical protein
MVRDDQIVDMSSYVQLARTTSESSNSDPYAPAPTIDQIKYLNGRPEKRKYMKTVGVTRRTVVNKSVCDQT